MLINILILICKAIMLLAKTASAVAFITAFLLLFVRSFQVVFTDTFVDKKVYLIIHALMLVGCMWFLWSVM